MYVHAAGCTQHPTLDISYAQTARVRPLGQLHRNLASTVIQHQFGMHKECVPWLHTANLRVENATSKSCITSCVFLCYLHRYHKGRDGTGWPASLPYIRKIHVSVAIGTQSGIRLHKRVPMVKIWGSSKNDQNWITGKLLNF